MKQTVTKALSIVAMAMLAPMIIVGIAKENQSAKIARNLDIFNSLYKELNTYYVDTLDSEKSIETAINSMLANIDPYTEYIPANEREDFRVISSGEYGGIGAMITQRGDTTYISEPYDGSPAARAGLLAGDAILVVNGDSVVGMSSDQVSSRLKGQPHSTISVTVKRPYVGADSIRTISFVREKIRVNPVPYYGVIRDNIGYINLSTYNEKSATRVKDALMAFKANGSVKSIVLDLRENGGGLLDQAVEIVGFFVPKGTEVLQTRGRSVNNSRTYKTTHDPIDLTTPLFVLVDGYSASASEITAGALQDLDRAVIVGSRSYGKGLVQTTRGLPFDATLKVTVAKYYIPSGRLIQAIDYSHRNTDGSVNRIPDSLTTVFHTAGGREVRDGGGITPDVKIEPAQMTRLYYNIYRGLWAYDFSVKYHAQHSTIASPEEFEVTDELFSEFKKFIDPKKFDYDKVCETALGELRKIANTEGYLNDSVKAQFDVLAKLLKHDLQHDLDINRKDISELLTTELLTRYYYQSGAIIGQLKHDECIDKVSELTNNPAEIDKILCRQPQKPTQKKQK